MDICLEFVAQRFAYLKCDVRKQKLNAARVLGEKLATISKRAEFLCLSQTQARKIIIGFIHRKKLEEKEP